MSMRGGIILLIAFYQVVGHAQTNSVSDLALRCASAEIQLQIRNSNIGTPDLRRYSVESLIFLKIERDGSSSSLTVRAGVDRVGATCVADSHGQQRVVFMGVCGATGCDTGESWGIIDPETLSLLLIPEDGNRARAEEILGGDVPTIVPAVRPED